MIEHWNEPLKSIGMSTKEHMAQFFDEAERHAGRRDAFLAAWKRGVALAGEQYFKISAASIEAATNKNQLRPDYAVIQDAIGRVSAGQGAFLAALHSFYNGEDGQKLLAAAGYPNISDIAAKLDPEYAEVIAELFLNYHGW